MKKLDQFGTVEKGKGANLILIRGNPLEDVANIKNPLGVMAKGRWYPQPVLEKMLRDVEKEVAEQNKAYRAAKLKKRAVASWSKIVGLPIDSMPCGSKTLSILAMENPF